MRVQFLLLLLFACCIGNTNATDVDGSYTLYLVRHAEKQADGSDDPALNDVGRYRSEQLAAWFEEKQIKVIWSSDYRRSRDTAGPLISNLGLELSLYDPHDLPALAKTLLDNRSNALVVGHSNTTPELTRLLCQCVISGMDESEYERLIVVSVSDDEVTMETFMQNTLFQPQATKH